MNTPPPIPDDFQTPPPPPPAAAMPPPPAVPAPPPVSTPPPPAPPSFGAPPAAPPPHTAAPGSDPMAKIRSAVGSVNWAQLGGDMKVFFQRFAAGDFSKIQPERAETPAVEGCVPRMASLIVWRRALLFLACLFTALLLLKTCFDPHTLGGMVSETSLDAQLKMNPNPSADEMKALKEAVKSNTDSTIEAFGASNVAVINGLMIGLWLSLAACLVFLIMSAASWRDWRRSRKLAGLALAVLLGPQIIAMLVPWSSMMNFSHIQNQGFGAAESAQMKMGVQIIVLMAVLSSALPFFYGLVNGVLRASLSTKTLIPASIVCGWGSMLLAVTISVPWFILLSVVNQLQLDALIVLGVVCLLAAPLSIVFKCRRLGVPLTPGEASPLVKKSKLFLTGLNVAGMGMIIAYLSDKGAITGMQVATLIVHYFANLLLVQVVAVDLLVLLLDRAHRKLASDPAPDESLRQISEVLPRSAS